MLKDNKSAIRSATNQGYTPRARNIIIRTHFVRGHVENGEIERYHVLFVNRLEDYITKAIPTLRYLHPCELMALFDLPVEMECNKVVPRVTKISYVFGGKIRVQLSENINF